MLFVSLEGKQFDYTPKTAEAVRCVTIIFRRGKQGEYASLSPVGAVPETHLIHKCKDCEATTLVLAFMKAERK